MKQLVFLILLLLTHTVTAQNTPTAGQIDSQTGNLIYSTVNPPPQGAQFNWSGFIPFNTGGGGLSGGNIPAYNSNTGTFIFGYAQGTVSYSTAISSVNFALATAGSNIRVNGLKYSWEYFNQDFSRGTLNTNINLTSNTGQVLQNYNYNLPQTTNGWTKMSGQETFATQYATSNLGNLNVNFTGKDDRFWAGYYGPQIRDFGVSLLYSVAAPPPIPTDFSKWITLAGENDSFTLSKTGVVRYGASGTYIYQEFQPGTYSCSNGAWGKDPIGGVYKYCDLGTNPPPAPTVPTTTTNTTTTVTNSIIAAAAEPLPPTTTTTTTTTVATTDASTTPTTSTTTSPTTTSSPTTASSTTSSTTSATSPAATPVASASVTTSSPSSSRSAVDGTSIGLSVVSRNQQREQSIAMQAVQSALATAEQVTQQTQQEALSVASQAVANSFAVAQFGTKTTSGAVDVKTTTNNTDLTFQNNQSSQSVSLFASPTTQTSQKQNDNQNKDFGSAPVATQQTTRTTQTNQQAIVTTDTSSRPATLQSNLGMTTNTELELKPQGVVASKVVETNNTGLQSNQESTAQQTQPTYTLLAPQALIATAQPITQKINIDTTQPTTNSMPLQETVATQPSSLYSLLPPQAPVVSQVSTYQPLSLTNDNKPLAIETTKIQETVSVSLTSSFSLLAPQAPAQQFIQPNTNTLNAQPTQISLFSNQPTVTNITENTSSESQKMLLDRSNPLFQTLDNKPIETQSNNTLQQGPSVNRNAQNNEVAGGVDLTRMAQAPAGYNDYLNFTLRDAAFYAPKEVYKNQRVVDNVRILRQLSSDRLHQEMVNQQYERK